MKMASCGFDDNVAGGDGGAIHALVGGMLAH